MSKIDYTLTGIDQEGNIAVDVPIPEKEAAECLLLLVAQGLLRVSLAGEPMPTAPKTRKQKVPKTPRAPKEPTAKDDQNDAIRDLLKEGKKPAEIVSELGLKSPALVYVLKQKMKNAGELPKT